MINFSDFDGLALFTRVVQAGSLAAAERATGIPKATLSRRLTVLEAELDAQLIRRTRKGVVLTEQGQKLFDQGRTAIGLAEQAIAEVRHDRAAFSGMVRISLPPDIGVATLSGVLIRFVQLHPNVVIDMTLDDRRVSLAEEGYDLVVRMGDLSDSDLVSRRIAALPRTLVASPAFLVGRSPITTPEELGRTPALAISRDIPEWKLADPTGNEISVRPSIVFSANRQTILTDAAIAGLGVVSLPTFLVDEHLRGGRLVRVLPVWSVNPVAMTALWQRNRISTRLVAAIADAFAHQFVPK